MHTYNIYMLENTEWAIKIQQKLATQGTQDEKKPKTNRTQCVLDTTMHTYMLENTEWAIKIQEKLATQGTQDEKKPQTNRTQCVLDTTVHTYNIYMLENTE